MWRSSGMSRNPACRAAESNAIASTAGLKEDAHVLGQHHTLFKYDLAAGDLPCAIDAPQDILARTDVKLLLGLRPVSVDHEVGIGLALGGRIGRFFFDIGDNVGGARGRIPPQSHARID